MDREIVILSSAKPRVPPPGLYPSRCGAAEWGGLLVAVCIVLFAYNPIKPIWIDEFLHFAFGAYRSPGDAMRAIQGSLGNWNHGQTGVYFVLDYGLLRVFGANLVALRSPSILWAILLLVAALAVFDAVGMPRAWRWLGCAAILGQQSLMWFVSEARPYMPLAGSSVAALAYYTTPIATRRRLFIRAIGYVGVIGGAVMHPYFSLYWILACLAAFLVHVSRDRARWSLVSIVEHADPLLVVLGGAAYIGVGLRGWMTAGHPEFNLDPFQWTGRGLDAVRTFGLHLEFLGVGKLAFAAFAIATSVAVCWSRQPAGGRLAAPLALLVGSAAVSLLISYVSYANHYWIAPRQWVASIALCAVGATWLIFEVRFLLPRGIGNAAALLFAGLVLFGGAFPWGREQATRWTDYLGARRPVQHGTIVSDLRTPRNNDEWVELARANIAVGGPVWEVFKRFYSPWL